MAAGNQILVSGAREHNLKDISLALPRDALVVITGLSGSGKSSLAFDTIYAEGQRRYVESLSAYARQFLGQMDKPDVDSIEGLSPAISIDQKTTSRNPRSTVGTVTEIYDYLRLLWARVGKPHCPICGRPIVGQSAEQIIDQVMELAEGTRFMVLAPVVRGRKGEYGKLLEELRADGFARVKIDERVRMLEESIVLDKRYKHDISVVVDRLVMRHDLRKRLADSIETAVGLADGLVEIEIVGSRRRPAAGDAGALLRGEGRARGGRADHARGGARAGHGVHVLRALRLPRARALAGRARAADLLLQLPPRRLRPLHGAGLADGDRPRARRAQPVAVDRRRRARAVGGQRIQLLRAGHRGDRRAVRRRPRGSVGGAAGGAARPVPVRHRRRAGAGHLPQPLRARRSYATRFEGIVDEPRAPLPRDRLRVDAREDRGVHVAARRARPAAARGCAPESRAVLVGGTRIEDFCALSARRALEWLEEVELSETDRHVARLILREISERLRFLENVGIGYLSMDRAAATLSGGEAQRIRLATQIGSSLVGVLYILDEPSIGLHQRDNSKLIATLERLRDLGNTVIVVEHDEQTMRAADHLVDLGPGRGRARRADRRRRAPPPRSSAWRSRSPGSSSPGARTIAVPERRRTPAGYVEILGATPAQPARHRRARSARRAHVRHRRLRLGQVDARQRGAATRRSPTACTARASGRARTARSTASSSSTRSSRSTSRRSGARRARTRPPTRGCST